MALDDSALSELLSRLTEADSADVFREVLRLGLQALVEAEATAHIGAGRHEATRRRARPDATVGASGWCPRRQGT